MFFHVIRKRVDATLTFGATRSFRFHHRRVFWSLLVTHYRLKIGCSKLIQGLFFCSYLILNLLNSARYRPEDLSHSAVLKLLSDTQKEPHKGREAKKAALIENFKFIKTQFKPVMRHYFTEIHKTPISWFAMRLKYTRSVATTSIVGHILGLGDRHISNILLDSVTGEVVHIDLGIAFEQACFLAPLQALLL